VIAFIRSVPEIAALSGADQRIVISASLHRLLLLFMAESNIHFVVAPVLQCADVERITESRHEPAPVVLNEFLTVSVTGSWVTRTVSSSLI